MKTTTIITIIIFVHSVGLAQNVHKTTFQRPEVATLSAEVQAPVSLNSGALAIEIPLYTLKQGDITVPISISYDATGIRVGSHPGWTGQNWTLKAGGVITRVTKSIPDESRVAWDMYILNSVIRNEYFWGNAYNFFGILREHSNISEKHILALSEKFKEGHTDAMLVNLDGKNYYLVYEKSDIQDWMFLGLVQADIVNASMNSLQHSTILLLSATILRGQYAFYYTRFAAV